jgi:REP element-mobilizing transposase RayT
MTRKIRRWEPGAIYHAAARAHCGDDFLADDEDRAFLVKRAVRAFEETDAVCLAWAVMRNHYHMLVRCERPPGATFARLNTAIAWRMARRRGERGAVFQGRFFSDTCDDETSLLERLSYVLANPIHHGVVRTVAELCDYRWSPVAELLGRRTPVLTDVDACLALIHPDPAIARRTLLELLEIRARRWAEDDRYPTDDPDLAEPRAASAPQAMASLPPARAAAAAALPSGVEISCPGGLAALVPVVCNLTGADPDAVQRGMQTRPEYVARSVIAYVACDIGGASMIDAAGWLGVSASALTHSRRRGRLRLATLGVSAREVLSLSGARVS